MNQLNWQDVTPSFDQYEALLKSASTLPEKTFALKNTNQQIELLKQELIYQEELIELFLYKNSIKFNKDELKLQQHRKKILLAGCEPVMGFNYNVLAMDDYPENSLVSAARRDRDYWLAVCALFTTVFFFGLLGFIAACLGVISAEAVMWGIQIKLFDFAYQPHYSLWLYLPIVSTLVIGWVSYIHIRHVPRTAPMEILRQYS